LIAYSGRDLEVGIACHFDAVPNSPGANDDASAVAVCLDVLRKVKENPLKNIGVRGLFFDQEEAEMRRSKAYVEAN